MRYVLSYDIRQTRRRTRIAHLLEAYGERVQYSVFEANLTHQELALLLARLHPLLDDDDSFRVYPLCRDCLTGVQRLGADEGDPLLDPTVIIV